MKKTIKDFDLNNKTVLIRCDFNVPLENGKIVDDTRITAALPTIEYAIGHNAKVVLFSHLGRVKTEEDKKKNDLKPVSIALSKYLKQEVKFSNETRGKELEDMIKNLKEKEVLLVQNTRYEDLDNKKESSNDKELGKYWSSLGDIFINDAFGTIHREHASNVGISTYLDSGIGFLVEKELKELDVINHPNRPFVVMLGGSKVEDKIGVIKNVVSKADYLLIGGAMSFTFLKANNVEIGKSLLDEENLDFCKEMLDKYKDKIILPSDFVVTDSIDNPTVIKNVDEIDKDLIGVDVGSSTIDDYKKILTSAKTILWNGPFGVYEKDEFAKGTKELLKIVSSSDSTSILGGGDIVAAASKFGYKDKVTHASTGGGATLTYLEGVELPGLKNIPDKK